MAPKFNAVFQQYARGRLVDLGCGRVPMYLFYRDLAETVTCVDWALSAHNQIHIDVFQDLNEPLSLPDSCADTVVLTSVLEHIYNPRALLGEIYRILAPEGTLILNVPFYYWLHEMPHDYYRYTIFALRRMLTDCGLEVLQEETTGGAPEALCDIVCKLTSGSRFASAFLLAVMTWLTATSPVKRISQKTSMTMPFGYIVIARKPESTSADLIRNPLV